MNKFFRKSLTIGFAALLAGCTVGPNYHSPNFLVPSQWFSSDKSTPVADPDAEVEQEWWQHFHDPALDHLIDIAAHDNYDLKIADGRIIEARAAVGGATADLFPTIDANASFERQRNQIAFPGGGSPIPGFNLAKPFDTYEPGFDASWELDLFGKTRRQIEAARAQLEATRAARDDARVSLLAEVARTYVEIRQDQAQLALAQQTVTADQQTQSITQELFRAGTAPQVDSIRARAQVENAQAQIPYFESQLAQAEFSLDVLLGKQPGFTHGLVNTTAPIPTSSDQLVLAVPAKVIAHRPDVYEAERQLASATAKQGVAVAQLFPDISIGGFLGFFSADRGTLFEEASKSWRLTGTFNWPLLDFGKLEVNVDVAKAQQVEALNMYKKTVISALADVDSTLIAYEKEQQQQQKLASVVADQQQAVDVANQRYHQGLTDFTEVLDTERQLYDDQSRNVQAQALVTQDLVAVYKALGGGWREAPAK